MKYLWSFLLLLGSINISSATIFNEIGDAGELVATAQNTSGLGNLDTINGHLKYDGVTFLDAVDMYKINVNDFSNFTVSMTASLSEDNNPIPEVDAVAGIWLFDLTGDLLTDDSFFFFNIDSEALLDPLTSDGMYFLAVAFFGVEPDNFVNLDTGWFKGISNLQEMTYGLELTGAEFSQQVPAPAIAWLLSAGLLSFLGYRKKVTIKST